MFRRPRDSTDTSTIVGRPPTPPATPSKTPFTLAKPPSVPAPRMPATKLKTNNARPVNSKGTPSKQKAAGKPNGSILSFFKKSDELGGEALFVGGGESTGRHCNDYVEVVGTVHEAEDAAHRYNEVVAPSKRRRMSGEDSPDAAPSCDGRSTNNVGAQSSISMARRAGPFMDASDSENEDDIEADPPQSIRAKQTVNETAVDPPLTTRLENSESLDIGKGDKDSPRPPALLAQATSVDFQDFEQMEDFDEDIFEEGDEFLERKYMEEQAELEAAELRDEDSQLGKIRQDENGEGQSATTCPICQTDLGTLGEREVSIHVNNCLDGNAPKNPSAIGEIASEASGQSNGIASANQYRRIVRPPKPGQANPFILGEAPSGGSAFNKLMSGHAEDAAWAEAAAAENASRGKPAYQRTCPFYKILPGLSICVDAFRYGAVAGCNAYFLSHFHSDHYIGLTSSWTHGPIYCSKVTANLVRQQLRVDAQYVVPLEFEKPVEIPGTRGVKVTMISANHCPGSSLFLYEKVIGKKTNGEPRLQRILHCGDFRACKMHVEHPLLMPEVQDKLSGKTKEQKIDVCYLDTTYLNPKYAFPSQRDVIKACADMCVCLSKDTPDDDDGWETMKRQRAGEGMAKFVRKESVPEIKSEPVDGDKANDMKIEPNPHASQQILSSIKERKTRGRLLVVVGPYSIGKERICLGIARAMNSKIYAPPSKQRIIAALEDPELDALMTNDPREAQVHMTPLFEIRAETLDDYLRDFFPHFTRAVGFRPSGWNYRPPNTRFIESPSVQTVLHGDNWKSVYSMRDLVPQRGSSSRASCFGVPYSEHSSFRELTMFCCALRIEKIIPTVNIGSQKSRERMKAWCERWTAERRKNGLFTGWE